jgi:hypothetical protein
MLRERGSLLGRRFGRSYRGDHVPVFLLQWSIDLYYYYSSTTLCWALAAFPVS